ncbi:MAG: alkaline phosphatase family protein, partial [Myxococcota bacterium]|nr:alkaline phosphatase family protein [Myxococcota bacterium]
LATQQLKSDHFKLSMIYLRRTDPVSHFYWYGFEPELYPMLSQEQLDHGREVLYEAYRDMDRYVGEIMDAAPDDARVVVVSDHGFHARPAGRRLRSLVFFDVDRLLQELGFQHQDGGEIVWAKTRATSLKDRPHFEGRIRINLEGREAQGSVPVDKRTEVMHELEQAIRKMRCKHDGSEAFEVKWGLDADPPVPEADLVVRATCDDGTDTVHRYRTRKIEGLVTQVERRSGFHVSEPPGVLFVYGQGVRKDKTIEGVSIHDIAPTVLYMLGLPYGEDMEGRPSESLFTDRYLRLNPVASIPSWEEVQHGGQLSVESSSVDPRAVIDAQGEDMDELLLEQLETLG